MIFGHFDLWRLPAHPQGQTSSLSLRHKTLCRTQTKGGFTKEGSPLKNRYVRKGGCKGREKDPEEEEVKLEREMGFLHLTRSPMNASWLLRHHLTDVFTAQWATETVLGFKTLEEVDTDNTSVSMPGSYNGAALSHLFNPSALLTLWHECFSGSFI